AGLAELKAVGASVAICLTGPAGERRRKDARAEVLAAFAEIAAAAAALEIRLALEPIHRDIADGWSLISSLPDACDFLESLSLPGVGVLYDTWHLGDDETSTALLPTLGEQILGVHIS